MPLQTASVLSGATITPSGGTALAFTGAGIRNNTHPLFVAADADLRTRRTMMCTVKDPKVSASAPNGYTQARSSVTFKSPLSLDNGSITVNTVRVEVSYDVETSAAELAELKVIGAQILTDSDFDALFQSQSLA